MFNKWSEEIPPCPECGEKFKDAFEAIDHMLDDDEQFDPALILPGGYRLMIGSLLRKLYNNSEDSSFVKEVTESTYATLFMAEFEPESIGEVVEDFIVESEMEKFDAQLKNLFKNGE